MNKQKKKEAWILTVNDDFYYKDFINDCYGGGWEFTPYIEMAFQFPTKFSAVETLEGLTSGGDFKDTRGNVTPTSAFGVRKMTSKDFREIEKREKAHRFYRNNKDRVAL